MPFTASNTGSPKLMLGTKRPSIMSKCISSIPAASTAATESARCPKSAPRRDADILAWVMRRLAVAACGVRMCIGFYERGRRVYATASSRCVLQTLDCNGRFTNRLYDHANCYVSFTHVPKSLLRRVDIST